MESKLGEEAVLVAADRLHAAYDAMLTGEDIGRLPDWQPRDAAMRTKQMGWGNPTDALRWFVKRMEFGEARARGLDAEGWDQVWSDATYNPVWIREARQVLDAFDAAPTQPKPESVSPPSQ